MKKFLLLLLVSIFIGINSVNSFASSNKNTSTLGLTQETPKCKKDTLKHKNCMHAQAGQDTTKHCCKKDMACCKKGEKACSKDTVHCKKGEKACSKDMAQCKKGEKACCKDMTQCKHDKKDCPAKNAEAKSNCPKSTGTIQ